MMGCLYCYCTRQLESFVPVLPDWFKLGEELLPITSIPQNQTAAELFQQRHCDFFFQTALLCGVNCTKV